MSRRLLLVSIALACGACAEALPAEVEGYRDRCVRLNAEPIPRYAGDPHGGRKNVYACNVSMEALVTNRRPFPVGTLIVKESTDENEDFPWLVAIARKNAGGWRWDEYTRNFEDEAVRRIPAGQGVCTDCHQRARGADWIFTVYAR